MGLEARVQRRWVLDEVGKESLNGGAFESNPEGERKLGAGMGVPASMKMEDDGAPGWLSQLSIRLWLRSLSHGAWVQAPRQALLESASDSVSPSLSLPLPCLLSVSQSLSQK